jgi:mono/diheme cytochrome c family protein
MVSRLAFAIPLLLVSCDSLSTSHIAPPVPSENVQLTRGRRLYLTTCVRCHAPEPIAKYTVVEWAEIMPEMVEDSRLSPADAAAVTSYVQVFARQDSL